eukprot:scaffold45431_cov35-Attheya_sp.AAC.1
MVEQLVPIAAEEGAPLSITTTTTPMTTPHAVVAWENPFADEPKDNNGELVGCLVVKVDSFFLRFILSSRHNTKANSVASFVTDPHAPEGGRGPAMNRVLMANLPYRTLDIHVATASPSLPSSSTALDQSTSTISIIDNWNNGQDETFSSYLVREAIHKNIRMMKMGGSSFGTDVSESSDNM